MQYNIHRFKDCTGHITEDIMSQGLIWAIIGLAIAAIINKLTDKR